MKLKKIASLMLAGIMAVSMLAGCKTASNNGNGGEGEGEGTQTSGYSAVMADELKDALKDKDYITFSDNATDESSLEAALNYIGMKAVEAAGVQTTPDNLDDWDGNGWDEFKATIKKGMGGNSNFWNDERMNFDYWNNQAGVRNETVKIGAVYAVDGNIGETESVKMIADKLKTAIAGLEESVEVTTANGGTLKYDYSYVISVSVANKTIGDYSADFVLVTATRNVD